MEIPFQTGEKLIRIEGVQLYGQEAAHDRSPALFHTAEPGPAIRVIEQQQHLQLSHEVLQLLFRNGGLVLARHLGGDGGEIDFSLQKFKHRSLNQGEPIKATSNRILYDDAGIRFRANLQV